MSLEKEGFIQLSISRMRSSRLILSLSMSRGNVLLSGYWV